MKNNVLLNAYGMKNIGDAAITMVALKLIGNWQKSKGAIDVMFIDRNENLILYGSDIKLKNIWSPYGAAIESNKETPISVSVKIWRFITIFINSALHYFFWKNYVAKPGGVYGYITSIKNAEYVFGSGGGYLRTKNKYQDFFGLLLTLMPIYIAKLNRKPIIFFPMSFGNFASDMHKRLAYRALKGTTVFCRDEISYAELNRLDVSNSITLVEAPDLALYLGYEKQLDLSAKMQSMYVVLTARKWLNITMQANYEWQLISTILALYDKYKIKTVFISMAYNSVEDNDYDVAKVIDRKIQNSKIFVISSASNPEAVQDVINGARFAICTRMHSAILAVTTSTPIITIGYEYKTKGLMLKLDLEEWHTEINTVSFSELMKLVERLLIDENYNSVLCKINNFYKRHPSDIFAKIFDNL